MRIQERSKHKLKISVYMNKCDISKIPISLFFSKNKDKNIDVKMSVFRISSTRWRSFRHKIVLLRPQDGATGQTQFLF